MKARLAAWVAPVGAAMLALVVHLRDVHAPFFADDWLFLDATRHRSLFAALTAPDPIGNFARPLGRQAWFWTLDRLGGGSPELFHAANLALFVIAVLLVAALAHRVAGPRAAAVAAPFFALTHAADVPLLWASGSQDLLALVLALGALLVVEHVALAAGVLLLLALLAKETVLFSPLLALLLLRRTRTWGASLRGALPMFGALVLWAFTVGARGFAQTLGGASSGGAHATHTAAAMVAFARTLTGFETGGQATLLAGVVLVVALGAALTMLPALLARAEAPRATTPDRGALVLGLVWVLAGALPVAAVAPIWSAYYFLFALAGAAIALGAACAAAPPWAGAVLVAALALGSAQARTRSDFAQEPDAWSTLSHVNRRYLSEGSGQSRALLAELKRIHPTLAPNTTLFWSGLPPFSAFQAGDGPLVRVAYGDTSLRAYYLADMTVDRERRGPFRILRWVPATNSLEDTTDQPMTLVNVAMSMLVRDDGAAVDGALDAARVRGTITPAGEYVAAWRAWERGDQARAGEMLASLGYAANGQAEDAVQAAAQAIASGDTATASALMRQARLTHVLDPAVQGLSADLALPNESQRTDAVLAAYASRVLAPQFPYSWRRWASIQILYGHYRLAHRSLERYFELAPEARTQDAEALEWLDKLATGPVSVAVP